MRHIWLFVTLLILVFSSTSSARLSPEEAQRVIREHKRDYQWQVNNNGWPPLNREYTIDEWLEWDRANRTRGFKKPIVEYYAVPEIRYEMIIGTSWWVEGNNCAENWKFYKDSISIDVYHYYAGPTPSAKAKSSRNCWLRIYSTNKEFTDTVKTKQYCKQGWPAYWYPDVPEYDRKTNLWIKDIHLSSSDGVVYNKYDVYRIAKFSCKDLKTSTMFDAAGNAHEYFGFSMKEYREDGNTPVYGFSVPMYYYFSRIADDELRLKKTEIEYIVQKNYKMIGDSPEGVFTKQCPVPLNMWMWKTK